MTDEDCERRVLRAALTWWRGKRPCHWTEKQHIEQSVVNCVGPTEWRLARAVAKWRK